MNVSRDELAVRSLVDALVLGWNAQDGSAYARPFAVDADFTNVMGLRARGREAIARGHDEILATVFKGTTLAARVDQVRFLRPDVAVADVAFNLHDAEGKASDRYPPSMAGLIAVRDGDAWSIAVFRNMIPFQRPLAGPMERSLAGERGAS